MHSAPAIDASGRLFVGNDDRRLYAVNTATGQVIWNRTTNADVQTPVAIGSNGRVYFGDLAGYLYAVGSP